MGYKHVSHEEREIIAEMRSAGKTLVQIGERLRRLPGTISRELKRNRESDFLFAVAGDKEGSRSLQRF